MSGMALKTGQLGIFATPHSFDFAVRSAEVFAKSTIVPKDFQNNLANCIIAMDMSCRLGVNPLMVMQELYIVYNRPAWSSKFLISMINSSGKYATHIDYELTGSGDKMACFAFVIDKNGNTIKGPLITMAMAKAEGWVDKSGSKWKTMPEVMIRYRAASFFARLHCGDLTMGFYTDDEVREEFKEFEETPVEKLTTEVKENANKVIIEVDENGEVITEKDSVCADAENSPDKNIPTEEKEVEPGFMQGVDATDIKMEFE